MRVIVTPSADIDWKALGEAQQQAVEDAIRAGTQLIANDARRAVTQGPKTGHTYKRGTVSHQASAPGEAPASDTGRLAGSIVADVERDGRWGIVGVVWARTAYALYLEYGTRNMAARPFMLPAFEKNRARIGALIRQALATAAQRFARK